MVYPQHVGKPVVNLNMRREPFSHELEAQPARLVLNAAA
jgi:hypothetical protein